MKIGMTIKSVLLAAVMITAAGCGGGGGGGNTGVGGGTTGGNPYTHEELAWEFVDSVNAYMSGYDLDMMKVNTLQYDYIVVYDYVTDTYDAYYLGAYNPGENIADYLWDYDGYFYYDLDYIGGNIYEDYWTGVQFQKTEATSKDLTLMKALKEELTVKKMTEAVQVQFGLSESRSRAWAEAAYKLDSAPQGSLTDEQLDNIAVELVGSSITDIKAATQSGDVATIADQLKKAGDLNDGMTPDEITSKLGDVFGM